MLGRWFVILFCLLFYIRSIIETTPIILLKVKFHEIILVKKRVPSGNKTSGPRLF